jgi:two-component system, OmpR family, sensor histidine kinase KdpD
MSAREDSLASLAFGTLAAIALGVALIPLRGLTTASNLAFVFLALTIVVGHTGGRWPAVATALVSALSLNFFLTRPYLTLAIHGQDDVIAFAGLAACGLVAAALGSRQAVGLTRRRELDVVDAALARLALGPADAHLQEVLDSAQFAFPLAAIALRDASGRIVAAAGDRTKLTTPEPAPESPIPGSAATLGAEVRATPLPIDGRRLPLVVGRQNVGSLDLWGNGRPAHEETRRALQSLAHVLAALVVAGRLSGPAPEGPRRSPSAWEALPHSEPRE